MEISLRTFDCTKSDEHPKKFLKKKYAYIEYKEVTTEKRLPIIDNWLKVKAAKWFTMVKDVIVNKESFKEFFF